MTRWTLLPRRTLTLLSLVCLCWRSGSLSRWDIWYKCVWCWGCQVVLKPDKTKRNGWLYKSVNLRFLFFFAGVHSCRGASVWRCHKPKEKHTHIAHTQIHIQTKIVTVPGAVHPDPISGDCVPVGWRHSEHCAGTTPRSGIYTALPQFSTHFPLGKSKDIVFNHTLVQTCTQRHTCRCID